MDYLPKPLDLPAVEAAFSGARGAGKADSRTGCRRLLKEEMVDLGRAGPRAGQGRGADRGDPGGAWSRGGSQRFLVYRAFAPGSPTGGFAGGEPGRTDEEVESVRQAGLLHDIGMISVPEGLMAKQGTLTPAEFEMIKRHIWSGPRSLRRFPSWQG